MRTDPLVKILKKEFLSKKIKFKNYSLRRYSRDLGLDPSNLSKILKQQKKVGDSLRMKIGQRLGFNEEEMIFLLNKPEAQQAIPDSQFNEHNLATFQVISEWQHYAILEYFKLKGASSSPNDIAEHFGLKLSIVNESLGRLISVGLLQKIGNKFSPTDESSSSILQTATSKAHREQQKQILEGAINALDHFPVELRSQSSMTMAINPNKLPEAREVIKRFRREMMALLENDPELTDVYQLSVSLYPLSVKNKLKES